MECNAMWRERQEGGPRTAPRAGKKGSGRARGRGGRVRLCAASETALVGVARRGHRRVRRALEVARAARERGLERLAQRVEVERRRGGPALQNARRGRRGHFAVAVLS